jgi:hypothetical protein
MYWKKSGKEVISGKKLKRKDRGKKRGDQRVFLHLSVQNGKHARRRIRRNVYHVY